MSKDLREKIAKAIAPLCYKIADLQAEIERLKFGLQRIEAGNYFQNQERAEIDPDSFPPMCCWCGGRNKAHFNGCPVLIAQETLEAQP